VVLVLCAEKMDYENDGKMEEEVVVQPEEGRAEGREVKMEGNRLGGWEEKGNKQDNSNSRGQMENWDDARVGRSEMNDRYVQREEEEGKDEKYNKYEVQVQTVVQTDDVKNVQRRVEE
jgi:hypothetical protein